MSQCHPGTGPNDNPEPTPIDNPDYTLNDNPRTTPIHNLDPIHNPDPTPIHNPELPFTTLTQNPDLNPIHNPDLDDDETLIAALVNDPTIDDKFDMDDTFLANDIEITALISIQTICDMDMDLPNLDEQNLSTINTNEEEPLTDKTLTNIQMETTWTTHTKLTLMITTCKETHKTTPTS